jgi:solute carrier family 25 iron transporter 28/37
MFMTPFDTVKQRMQLGHYRSMYDCLRSTMLKEGVRALYVSLPPTLFMNIPYGSIMVAMNESSRKWLNPRGEHRLDVSMLAGAIAGASAALVTTPLDVVKTRLQIQDLQPCPVHPVGKVLAAPSSAGLKYAGTASALSRVLAEEGLRGFFRGAGLRMLVHAPSVAISWTAYDTAKRALTYRSSVTGKIF